MFYDTIAGLTRILVVTPLAYIWLIAVLRVTGKRTLAQLNAFDFVVTVALGSTLATVVLNRSVAWSEVLWHWGCSRRSSWSSPGSPCTSR